MRKPLVRAWRRAKKAVFTKMFPALARWLRCCRQREQLLAWSQGHVAVGRKLVKRLAAALREPIFPRRGTYKPELELFENRIVPSHAFPHVQSINETTPSGGTAAAGATFTVIFSEPVTGVEASDFQLATSSYVTATTPVTVSGSDATYTVRVAGIKLTSGSSGTLGLNLADNNSIHDSYGDPLVKVSGVASFQSQATFAVGTNASAEQVADLTGDGNPDLIVANGTSDNISILLGNGDGTFQNQMTFATGGISYGVAVGDVNGDGIPDVVASNCSSPGSVSVLLGNGNGTFQNPVTFAIGNFPVGVDIADVNGDGKPDLVVANEGSYNVGVLLGNGNGTFKASWFIQPDRTRLAWRWRTSTATANSI